MSRGVWLLLLCALAYGMWMQFFRPLPNAAELADGYQITVLEPYGGQFRVLRREDYQHDDGAKFAPMDFAVGWGVMADPKVYKHIEVDQSNRWYRWHVDRFPIPRREIETHSANMHIVPANAAIATQLKDVKADDLIELQGELIEINGTNGWHWRSSLSRDDTGDGACELMRVQSIRWIEKG